MWSHLKKKKNTRGQRAHPSSSKSPGWGMENWVKIVKNYRIPVTRWIRTEIYVQYDEI